MSSSKVSIFCVWLLSMALFGAVLQAQASPALTARQAGAYVDLLPEVRAFSQRLGNDLGAELQRELQPKAGETFAPHSKGLTILQQRQPRDYQALSELVATAGFASAQAWATTGDRVMLGYAALKAEQLGPELLQLAAGMGEMNPQMLALMSPKIQARLKQFQLLARTLVAVDPADKAVVKPLLPQLDGYWAQDWQQFQGR